MYKKIILLGMISTFMPTLGMEEGGSPFSFLHQRMAALSAQALNDSEEETFRLWIVEQERLLKHKAEMEKVLTPTQLALLAIPTKEKLDEAKAMYEELLRAKHKNQQREDTQ